MSRRRYSKKQRTAIRVKLKQLLGSAKKEIKKHNMDLSHAIKYLIDEKKENIRGALNSNEEGKVGIVLTENDFKNAGWDAEIDRLKKLRRQEIKANIAAAEAAAEAERKKEETMARMYNLQPPPGGWDEEGQLLEQEKKAFQGGKRRKTKRKRKRRRRRTRKRKGGCWPFCKRKPRVAEPLLETEEDVLDAIVQRLEGQKVMSREEIQKWEEERARIKEESEAHPSIRSRGGKRKTRRKRKKKTRRGRRGGTAFTSMGLPDGEAQQAVVAVQNTPQAPVQQRVGDENIRISPALQRALAQAERGAEIARRQQARSRRPMNLLASRRQGGGKRQKTKRRKTRKKRGRRQM